jgi:hypothetical protein
MVEDIVLSSPLVSHDNHSYVTGITRQIQNWSSSSCWYTSLLKVTFENNSNPPHGTACYGLPFDFSDHVVLFFSHTFPSMMFEASFCFLFPFLPVRCSSFTQDAKDGGYKQVETRDFVTSPRNRFMLFVWNTLLPILLLVLFLYLNILTLLAVHSTAAYFHSVGEVIVGYTISLLVQIPVGLIIWADEWNHVRQLVGFPIEREHVD